MSIQYEGKLFGHIYGRKYIPLKMTTEDVAKLEQRIADLQQELLVANALIEQNLGRDRYDKLLQKHHEICQECTKLEQERDALRKCLNQTATQFQLIACITDEDGVVDVCQATCDEIMKMLANAEVSHG